MYFDRQIDSRARRSRRSADFVSGERGLTRRTLISGSVLRVAFYFIAAGLDTLAILVSAISAGFVYHWLLYDPDGMIETFILMGSAIALVFVGPAIVRDEYSLARFSQRRPSFDRIFILWNVAFVSAIVLAFLSKLSSDVSRGTFVIFYGVGFAMICATRYASWRLACAFSGADGVASRRVFLVGYESELQRFPNRENPSAASLRIVASAVIRSADTLEEDLALAAASARLLRPEDIFILIPWSDPEAIEACIDAFLQVPASIHLGPERLLSRFSDILIDRTGSLFSLRLVGRPLSSLEVALKRAMDIIGASFGLILLGPVFAVIALLIKLESPGPALFTQRRYGFNQEPFRIFKFRSMSVVEDGPHVRQTRPQDPRITKVGAVLRRWNLDELPQLLNVLRGDMSLVGPRPHALSHDQKFERAIAQYARRHNVKPGMTGWAQVNGHRGEIASENHLKERVAHDLYYIDRWSLAFDLKILLLTVISSKAYRNAR